MVLLPGCKCCGESCVEHTAEDFCGFDITANYYSYLEVNLYPPDGSNNPDDGWSVKFVDDNTNCTDTDYLSIFLRPDSGTDIYSKYRLPFIGPVFPPYDDPDYELAWDSGATFPNQISSSMYCGGIGVDGTDYRLDSDRCLLLTGEGGVVDGSEFCTTLGGCNIALTPSYPFRQFRSNQLPIAAKNDLELLFSGNPVRLRASGAVGAIISCDGCFPPPPPTPFTYAELDGFVTVQMKCEPVTPLMKRGSTVTKKTIGPGTELSKTLASWGFKESAKCSCKKMSRLMDGWGAACATEPHLTTIVDHLQKEAKKRGLPFVRKVGEMLVKRAVRKSQQNS